MDSGFHPLLRPPPSSHLLVWLAAVSKGARPTFRFRIRNSAPGPVLSGMTAPGLGLNLMPTGLLRVSRRAGRCLGSKHGVTPAASSELGLFRRPVLCALGTPPPAVGGQHTDCSLGVQSLTPAAAQIRSSLTAQQGGLLQRSVPAAVNQLLVP